MRIFNNFWEAFNEIERDLFEMGIESHSNTMQDKDVTNNPDYDTKEMIGYSFMLNDWDDRDDVVVALLGEEARVYCEQELIDRVSGQPLNPGNSYKMRKEVWNDFLRSGRFSYTYPERMHDQLFQMINHLKYNKESRQSIVTIYDKHDDMMNIGGRKRIPCSMYYHFMIREGGLTIVYTMRSCDFYTHMPIDIWLATGILEYVAAMLKIPPMAMIYFCDSLHAYRKDWGKRRIF